MIIVYLINSRKLAYLLYILSSLWMRAFDIYCLSNFHVYDRRISLAPQGLVEEDTAMVRGHAAELSRAYGRVYGRTAHNNLILW